MSLRPVQTIMLIRYRSNSFPDIKFQTSIISVICRLWQSSRKIFQKHGWASLSSIRLHIKLPLHFQLPGFLDFFRFSHFLVFSVTVVQIFVQIIALLFFTGRQQCGSHIVLSPPWLPPLTENLSCTIIRSVKRKKTIMNYHVEFEHVQTT